MKCLNCSTVFNSGQKFCGCCGQQLKKECPGCRADNPPTHTFCGQCGHNLINTGTCTLNKSGIIIDVNPLFLEILDQRRDAILDKPFSLLVYKKDLATFFTRWNDLINRSQHQCQEIKLKHRENKPVHAQIEYDFDKDAPENSGQVSMAVTDFSDRQLANDQLELKDNLINLIFTISKDITNSSPPYPEKLVQETLKQVCLFIEAQHCFICHINKINKRLETLHQWYTPGLLSDEQKNKFISFSLISSILSKLRRERSLIIRDINNIPSKERNELVSWHSASLGSTICHLIYHGNDPVGIIGITNTDNNTDWSQNSIDLVQIAGHILNVVIPHSISDDPKKPTIPSSDTTISPTTEKVESDNYTTREIDIIIDDLPESGSESTVINKAVPNMKFERDEHSDDNHVEKITTRDNSIIKLTCPQCGLPEDAPPETFKKLGCRLRVICKCQNSFSIMREQRWFYRKNIELPGSFQIPKNKRMDHFSVKDWDPMLVTNLSKTGLCFTTTTGYSAENGDELKIKFKLNNSKETLIEKTAIVKSVNEKNIGCLFQGNDPCDVALGFYLL